MQFLAISKPKEGTTEEATNPYMLDEVKATLNLYIQGKITNFYMRQDRKGVIFFVEADSEQAVKELLNQLPLVQKGLIEYNFTALSPLLPIGLLTGAFACEI